MVIFLKDFFICPKPLFTGCLGNKIMVRIFAKVAICPNWFSFIGPTGGAPSGFLDRALYVLVDAPQQRKATVFAIGIPVTGAGTPEEMLLSEGCLKLGGNRAACLPAPLEEMLLSGECLESAGNRAAPSSRHRRLGRNASDGHRLCRDTGFYSAILPSCLMRTYFEAFAAADAPGIIHNTGHAASSADRAGRAGFDAFAAALAFIRNAINAVIRLADKSGAAFSSAVLIPFLSIFIQREENIGSGLFRQFTSAG